MKPIIWLLVLGGVALGGMYLFGGYKDFDPEKQGREAKAAVKPGMTLAQVVDVAGKNPKIQPINAFPRGTDDEDGETFNELRPGTPVPFDYEKTSANLKKNGYPNGFILNYKYTEALAFDVHFDSTGKVTHVSDAVTMGTLLGY
jgi:hypothetical protein